MHPARFNFSERLRLKQACIKRGAEMTLLPSRQEFDAIREGYSPDPLRSLSLRSEAYTDPRWYQADLDAIIAKSWQWVCHVEAVRNPGDYVAVEIAGRPVVVVRDQEGGLRAFYNVCKHRAHQLLSGTGNSRKIMCPYHAWTYRLDGRLARAPHTETLEDFRVEDICLDAVHVEEFCGFVYVNLDPGAASLQSQSGDLANEIRHWAPDIDQLTFAHRLTYDIRSNFRIPPTTTGTASSAQTARARSTCAARSCR
jgi:phenylpropionate dioxygenase-like ring-hydroxylating dioxygenase large terminal subunit